VERRHRPPLPLPTAAGHAAEPEREGRGAPPLPRRAHGPADIVSGAISSDHVATLRREYFSCDRAVGKGTIRLRSLLRSIIAAIIRHRRHQDRLFDWECVRRRAAEIVEDLAYQTPELRQVALLPGGPMEPHNVLPIWSGFRRSSHVKKKQACDRRPQATTLALAKLYLRKRSRLPSLSQESPDELLNKTLNWVAFFCR